MKNSREELIEERRKLTNEWQLLRGQTDPEAKQRVEELEVRVQETDQELASLENTDPEAKEKRNGWKKIGIGIGILMLILWGLWTIWISERLNQTEKALRNTQIELKKAQMSAVPTAQAQPKTEAAEKEAISAVTESAIVQKGEGVEHALIRQLQEDPFTFGFQGDATPKTVKKWAQKKAHQIAILAGYVNQKTGEEIRIKGNGGNIAYVLTVDGDKIFIEEYAINQDSGNFNTQPEQTNQLADSYGSSIFQGGLPHNLQSYEYVYRV